MQPEAMKALGVRNLGSVVCSRFLRISVSTAGPSLQLYDISQRKYIYTYIHTYIHIHIYIYIYVFVLGGWCWGLNNSIVEGWDGLGDC